MRIASRQNRLCRPASPELAPSSGRFEPFPASAQRRRIAAHSPRRAHVERIARNDSLGRRARRIQGADHIRIRVRPSLPAPLDWRGASPCEQRFATVTGMSDTQCVPLSGRSPAKASPTSMDAGDPLGSGNRYLIGHARLVDGLWVAHPRRPGHRPTADVRGSDDDHRQDMTDVPR